MSCEAAMASEHSLYITTDARAPNLALRELEPQAMRATRIDVGRQIPARTGGNAVLAAHFVALRRELLGHLAEIVDPPRHVIHPGAMGGKVLGDVGMGVEGFR